MQEVVGLNPAGPTEPKVFWLKQFLLYSDVHRVQPPNDGFCENVSQFPRRLHPMSRSRNSIPSYLLHSQSGRARAVWTDPAGTHRFRLMPGMYDS